MNRYLKYSKNEGFSLIELVIVVAVLAILSAIAGFSFTTIMRFAEKIIAGYAAKTIKKECEYNTNNSENKFTLSNLVGYSYQPNSSNSCSGGNDGKISLVSSFPSVNPNYHFNSLTGELTCTFQNSELSYPSCDPNSISKIANAKKFNGDKSLSGEFTGLETTERGFYYMDITPNKLETGEKMALLTPGGEHDLELFIVGTNEKLGPGTIDKNQEYTDQLNKGNFKICMSGGSSSWVNGRQSPTVCSRILPTEIANTIGISYSNGSYDVNYSGGSMSGSGGFAPGPGNSNQTTIGKFDQSTKEKIQAQYNKGYGLGSANDKFSNFNGSINTLRHVDTTNMDMGKPPWKDSEVSKNWNGLYKYFNEGGQSTPGDTYTNEDWENQKGF